MAGRRVNAKAYREAYAMKFAEEFSWRLRQARDAADSAVGSLVSVERPKRVQEAFYTAFPHMRPQPPSEEEKADMTASVSKPRKERRPTKADEMRSYRAFYSPTARAAQAAAETAASKVQLTRPQRATRVERSPGQSGALEG